MSTLKPVDEKDRTPSISSSSSNNKDGVLTSVGPNSTIEESLPSTSDLKTDPNGTKEGDIVKPADDFPDGGLRAWLVVFGGMCNTFATFGYVNAWGTFQEYYQETLLSQSSPSTIAWIGSVQYALIFLPGLVVGRLFDLGYFRHIFISSSILLVAATFLVAQCTQYWHFLLCQGVAIGLGCGGLFGPCMATISHWFKRRRGRALGLVAIGSSLGGTIIPIATKNLIQTVGFPWTMRIIGFILLVVLGICNLTMRPRLPPVNVKGGLLNLAAFKSTPYTVYCISSFVNFLGLFTMLIYVNLSATQLGSSPNLAFYFVSFANASSIFGRWTAGVLADRMGPMNVMIPFTFIAGILTYAWPFANSTAGLIVVTMLYGFCSGVYVSLLANPIMTTFGAEGDVGRRIGMLWSLTAIGALAGPPISGAINSRTGDFKDVGLYAGSAVMAGVALMLTVRYLVLGVRRGKI